MKKAYFLASIQIQKAIHQAFSQKNLFFPPNFKQDGFIHLCFKKQIPWVTNTFFKRNKRLFVWEIDIKKVKNHLRLATLSDGQTFPHLHQGLSEGTVKQILEMHKIKSGEWLAH